MIKPGRFALEMALRPTTYTHQAYKIVGPAIAKTLASPNDAKATPPELEKYTGLYRSFRGESAVVSWEGGLATFSPGSSDPLEGISKLKHIEGQVFRRIRSDEELGEEVVFELDEGGSVVRMQRHGNYMEKVN